jgi:hypothetical protein
VLAKRLLLNLVKDGFANTVLPLPAALEGIREGRLNARCIVSPSLERYLYLLRGHKPGQTAAVRQLEILIGDTIRKSITDDLWSKAYSLP